MIKFFRRIRFDLLEKNPPNGRAGKTGKPALPVGRYLKYAIGEIFLVVIGILLAIQINSWNQDRLSKKTEKVILNRLINDLEIDHLRLKKLQSIYQLELERNKDFSILIKKTSFSESELLKISQFDGVSAREINPRLTTYEEMINTGRIYNLSSESLVNEIIEYYRKLKDVETDTSEDGNGYSAYWNSRDFIEFWHMKNVNGDLDEMKKIAEGLLKDKNGDNYKHLLNAIVRGQDIGIRLVRRNEDLKGKNINLRKNITTFLIQ